jgi:DNA polymerase-3 subunit delta
MTKDMLQEDVLKSLQKGRLGPLYLFYGPGEFQMEKLLDRIKESLIPAAVRDLNLEVVYGGETGSAEILQHAQSLPFLADRRLIIVRRTEAFSAEALEPFLTYLEKPAPSTCLIFVAGKTDFNKPFYKACRSHGFAVSFEELKDRQVVPWIRRTAAEMGVKMDLPAAAYLHGIVGNKTRDLYGELEKLSLRFGKEVGIDQVKDSVKHSRVYTIFELMHQISSKNRSASLVVLNRFLEEEDKKDAPLRVIGMLNREMRLLWQTRSVIDKGGEQRDVMKKLGTTPYRAKDWMKQAKGWRGDEIEGALDLLYQADGRIKSGCRPKPVLENLILSLCS